MLFEMFKEDKDYEDYIKHSAKEYSKEIYKIDNHEIDEFYKNLNNRTQMQMQNEKDDICIFQETNKSIVNPKKNMCIHGKCKNACKRCGGSLICKHNRFGYSCKDCYESRMMEGKKSAYCEHLNNKTLCKICKIHNKKQKLI